MKKLDFLNELDKSVAGKKILLLELKAEMEENKEEMNKLMKLTVPDHKAMAHAEAFQKRLAHSMIGEGVISTLAQFIEELETMYSHAQSLE